MNTFYEFSCVYFRELHDESIDRFIYLKYFKSRLSIRNI